MSRRAIGVLLLLAGSEILGVLSGHWYFAIFNRTVPTAVVTEFNRNAAYALFLVRGLILGLALFLWSMLVILAASYFRSTAAPPASAATRP